MSLLHIKEGHEDGEREEWGVGGCDAVLYSVRSVVYDFARDTWRFPWPWRYVAMFAIWNFFIRGPLHCRLDSGLFDLWTFTVLMTYAILNFVLDRLDMFLNIFFSLCV